MNQLRRSLSIFQVSLWLSCTALFGQSSSGSLDGLITDPAGAAVAGARVTARNENTGVESRTVATDVGSFAFPNLQVGVYTLSAEHAGFKQTVRSGVNIATATRSSLNLSLEVGQVSETVNVRAEAPLLQTTTSDLGTVFNNKLMQDAPLFVSGGFRNPENFINFLPGVNGGAQDTSINGGSRRSKEILIDGASHTNPESGGVAFVSNGGIGSVEMYGEFKLITSNFSAEYGRSGGGVEVFVTRSGSNQLHGTVFDFLRNDKLDAAGWAVNQRRPFLGKSKVRQNEFGAAVGGPVFIPKLYDGRNRTFWYFTYNGYRQNGASGTGIATVPTALMKQGDFSELGSRLIYDPLTTQTANGVTTRQPFPGNRIPQNRFSSVSAKTLQYVPNPTTPGISNNFNTINSNTITKDMWSIKLDQSFSDRNRISFFYNRQKLSQVVESGLPGPLASGSDTQDTPDITRVNHDFTFAPTILNHFTFGLSRYQNLFIQLPAQQENWSQLLGLGGVIDDENSSFPIVAFNDNLTQWGNNPKTRGSQYNWTWQAADTVNWIKGRHDMKAGYEWRRGRTFQNPLDCSFCQGYFQFLSNQTALPTAVGSTGYAFASFLLGGVDNARRDYNTKGVDIKYGYQSLFFQDNIRVSAKLTLNLGLRWELYIPRTDTNLTLSAFDPTVPNPAANGRLGALSFAGEGEGRNGKVRFGKIYKDNFGPRVGFAYQVNSKTVLRGGYGMYFSAANGNTGGGCFPCGWGTSASPTPQAPNQFSPVFNWDAGFQVPAGFRLPPIIDPSYANGSTVLALSEEDGLAGRVQNWSFNVQQQLPFGLYADIAYVGSKSTRLNNYTSLNQIDPKNLSLGPLLSRPITDPEVVSRGFTKPYASFPDSGTLSQALRPYPQYNNVIHTYLGQGGNNYQALQAKLEKRYSSLTLLGAYTWSKTIAINGAFTQTGNGVQPQDAYNTGIEKALAIHDVPHVLNLTYVWDLPFGRGRRFLSTAHPLVRGVVGGWSLSGLQQYRSGTLIQLSSPNNTLGAGVLYTTQLRASTTGQSIRTGVNRTDLDPNDPGARWINRSAFSVPGPYQFGTASAFLNDLRNPPVYQENVSLIKRTSFTESVNLELRADVSNLLNRTAFGGVNVNLNDPNFGRITGVQLGPRLVQLGMKLNF